jgi:hypothetical protein
LRFVPVKVAASPADAPREPARVAQAAPAPVARAVPETALLDNVAHRRAAGEPPPAAPSSGVRLLPQSPPAPAMRRPAPVAVGVAAILQLHRASSRHGRARAGKRRQQRSPRKKAVSGAVSDSKDTGENFHSAGRDILSGFFHGAPVNSTGEDSAGYQTASHTVTSSGVVHSTR